MRVIPYASFEDKNKFFQSYKVNSAEYRINTRQEYDDFYNSFENEKSHSVIFRGVNEAKYKLYTSIQRAFIEGRINPNETIGSFVAKEINNIKNSPVLSKYYLSMGIPITDFLYLSFLQHYAAPTSFLDFTHNINIALYFATENVKYGDGNASYCIDDYISIYWIDLTEYVPDLTNIPELYINGYISGMKYYLENKNHIDGTNNLTKLSNYLAWANMENNGRGVHSLECGFIDNDNKNRHYSIGNIKDDSKRIQTYAKRYLENPTKTNSNQLKQIITSYFNDIIKIVNLNLIAQEGCFIHYNPQAGKNLSLNTSLEEYFSKKRMPLIHCANIHKSLAPYIVDENSSKGISQKYVYPDLKYIALTAMNTSRINIK